MVFPRPDANPLLLLAKFVALRLLNRRAVGGITGKLSFEHDDTLPHRVPTRMLAALRPCGVQGSRVSVQPPHRLWSLLMLEFRFCEFIDGETAGEPFDYTIPRAA